MDYIIGFVCGFLAGVVVTVFRLPSKKDNRCSQGYDYEAGELDFDKITEELNKGK